MSKKGLFKVVSLIAIVTIFSKIAGFVRDIVIAAVYGATDFTDAYFYAYQVVALALILLGGLGGPFHSATIAVFGKRFASSDKNISGHDNKLLSTFLTFTFVGFLILALLVAFYASPIMEVIAKDATVEKQELAAKFLVMMSPIIVIGGLVGIFYGILNVFGKYFWPSIAPLIASISIITAVVGFGGVYGATALAIGTVIGAIGMLLVQLPGFFKVGFKIIPNFNYKLEGFKHIGELLFPAMIGTTIGQINIYVDMFFVSGLPEGSWTTIVFANRLLQLPIGVLITAMLVPIFPLFTEFVAKKEFDNLKKYAHSTVLTLWLLAFPILVFILIFSVDGIRVLLERDKFDHNDTLMVSHALVFLSFSIIPYMARDTLTRIFYAYDDAKTPFYVGMAAIAVNVLMDWLLVGPLGVGGITLSTTIVTLFNMALLTFLIRKKVKDISLRKILLPTVKIALASSVMAIICYFINVLWVQYVPDNTLLVLLKLIIIAGIGFGSFFIVTILLKLEESRRLVDKLSGYASKL